MKISLFFFMKFQISSYFVIFISKVVLCPKWASRIPSHRFHFIALKKTEKLRRAGVF